MLEQKSKGLQTKAVLHQTLCAQVGAGDMLTNPYRLRRPDPGRPDPGSGSDDPRQLCHRFLHAFQRTRPAASESVSGDIRSARCRQAGPYLRRGSNDRAIRYSAA